MIRLHTYAALLPAPGWGSQSIDTEEGHFYRHEVADEAIEYYLSQAAGNIDMDLQYRLESRFETLNWKNCVVDIRHVASPTFLLPGVFTTLADESG